MFPPQGRGGAVEWIPGAAGGMPDNAEKRVERDFVSRVGASDARIRVEVPEERQRLAPGEAEPIVEWRAPASGLRDTA